MRMPRAVHRSGPPWLKGPDVITPTTSCEFCRREPVFVQLEQSRHQTSEDPAAEEHCH